LISYIEFQLSSSQWSLFFSSLQSLRLLRNLNLNKIKLNSEILSLLFKSLSSSRLRKLSIQYCSITSLPIEAPPNSVALESNSFCIATLKPKRRFFSSLHVLLLTNNLLSSLPPAFVLLANLSFLDLSYNRFTSVPPVLQHFTLRELNLTENPIIRRPPFSYQDGSDIDFPHRNQTRRSHNATVTCRRLCVVVLGGSGSGRKSFMKCIQTYRYGKVRTENDAFNQQQKDFFACTSYLNLVQIKGKHQFESATVPDHTCVYFHFIYPSKFQNNHIAAILFDSFSTSHETINQFVLKSELDESPFQMTEDPLNLQHTYSTDKPSRVITRKSHPNSQIKSLPQRPSSQSAPFASGSNFFDSSAIPLHSNSVIDHLTTSFQDTSDLSHSPSPLKKMFVPPIVVIVFNSVNLDMEVDRISHFLEQILLSTPDSRILFVGTHLDQWPISVEIGERFITVQRWFSKHFKFYLLKAVFLGFSLINSVTGEGLETVLQYLLNILEEKNFPTFSIPPSFLSYEAFLFSLKGVLTNPCISSSIFHSIANRLQITSKVDVLSFLLSSGALIYSDSLDDQLLFDLNQLTTIISSLSEDDVTSDITSSLFVSPSRVSIPKQCPTNQIIDLFLTHQLFIPTKSYYFLPFALSKEPMISKVLQIWPSTIYEVYGRHYFFRDPPPSILMTIIISKTFVTQTFHITDLWQTGLLISDNKESYSLISLNSRELILYTLGKSFASLQMFIQLVNSMQTLLEDVFQIQPTQYSICPHCLKLFELHPNLFNLLGINPNIPSTSLPPPTQGYGPQTPFSSSIYPSLYFSLLKLNRFDAYEGSLVECNYGGSVEMLDLIPECQLHGILKITSRELSLGSSLGFGSYADVQLAGFRNINVAVKIFKIDSLSDPMDVASDPSSELFREVIIMSQLRHPNIVSLIGVVISPPCVVMEYLESGSLYDYVLSFKSNSVHTQDRIHEIQPKIPWIKRIGFATNIASAMKFLHDKNYVHRDLKSPNILLKISKNDSTKLIAKVADFGTAREIKFVEALHHTDVDNPRWIAPEILRGEPYNEKIDVYSFGS
jgi:hypothetical protein